MTTLEQGFHRYEPPHPFILPSPIPICTRTKGRALGARLTSAKMADCPWLKPHLVGQFEFVEWTEDAHLRHRRFVSLREDRKAKDVKRDRLTKQYGAINRT